MVESFLAGLTGFLALLAWFTANGADFGNLRMSESLRAIVAGGAAFGIIRMLLVLLLRSPGR